MSAEHILDKIKRKIFQFKQKDISNKMKPKIILNHINKKYFKIFQIIINYFKSNNQKYFK